jgi:hypothetical protein
MNDIGTKASSNPNLNRHGDQSAALEKYQQQHEAMQEAIQEAMQEAFVQPINLTDFPLWFSAHA